MIFERHTIAFHRPSECWFGECGAPGLIVHTDRMSMECPPARYEPGSARPGQRWTTAACRDHLIDFVGVDVGVMPLC